MPQRRDAPKAPLPCTLRVASDGPQGDLSPLLDLLIKRGLRELAGADQVEGQRDPATELEGMHDLDAEPPKTRGKRTKRTQTPRKVARRQRQKNPNTKRRKDP